MKALLIAINASYVHTNPAVRSIAAASGAQWQEYNINQKRSDVFAGILDVDADLIGFSCYIWNIEYVLKLASDLKQVCPRVTIMLGGPEATYRAQELLTRHTWLDYIFCGEAEHAFPLFLRGEIPDCILERGGQAHIAAVDDLRGVCEPFAHPQDRYDPNKIYYYESSRGCPFGCAYCLSCASQGVREKPLEQVFAELERLTGTGVRLVKFVDRTFNANKARAKAIFRWIARHAGETCFHFEVAPDLFDEELLEMIEALPKGCVQLEMGIQSCNEQTLAAVCRKMDVDKALRHCARIVQMGNVHVHLDLIAGLPYENMQSFAWSFDRVIAVFPHMLQLGFLKLLHGSRLREQMLQYGIAAQESAPYEVLRTSWMSAQELLTLKGVEELLDRYYNTGRAKHTLRFLAQKEASMFEVFAGLAQLARAEGSLQRPVSAQGQFELLADFLERRWDQEKQARVCLKQDYENTKIKGRLSPRLAKWFGE